MKKFIKSNYNINIDKLYKNKEYYFYSNSEKIYIIKTDKDKQYLDNLVNVSNELYSKYRCVSTFIKNNNGEFYTKYNDYYIVLLKYNDINTEDIYFSDIKNNYIDNSKLDEFNIKNEFMNIIDNLEKEMNEYNKEFPLIQKSIDYFIGMSENAIELLNDVNINNNVICHDVEIDNYNKAVYNNPFNFVKSNIMYDYATYFKYKFYYETIDYDELYFFIKSINKDDIIIFFGIMLYQKEYFNTVKKILLENEEENKINLYISNINRYRDLLIYIKDSLRNIGEIKEIEWLDK